MSDNPEHMTIDLPDPVGDLPESLAIMPLEQFILYPSMIAPIIVGDEKSKRLVDDALNGQRLIGVLTKRPEGESLAEFSSLYEIGTAANILKMLKMPDGTIRLLLHGIQRIRIDKIESEDPYLRAKIEPLHDISAKKSRETDALVKSLHGLLGKAIELSSLPEDLRVAAINITDPGRLADLIASNLSLKLQEQQELLETPEVSERLKRIHFLLNREIAVLELGSRIQNRVKSELDKNQREYLLREQMKAIRQELGEDESTGQEQDELKQRLDERKLPDHVRAVATKELNRLRIMQPASAEYTVARTYLDIILELPWMESTTDAIDLKKARKILDADHYNLEKAKSRILEYLAVQKLRKEMKGPILCFIGPPGVGKTSLGRSIANAMGRKFARISLGGLHDEAEIRGHRRTYIGAMPGQIVKSMRQAGANNPLILLDEIDKVGADYRGDPSAALLEVLDPEQNSSFMDHYLDMPFDLSKVMFITTANQYETIPGPLRDRMELIEVSGYTQREKLQIAKKYTIPKQMKENGLTNKQIEFSDPAVMKLIEDYTREAGMRGLERRIGDVSRKVARKIVEGETKRMKIVPATITKLLGPAAYYSDVASRMGAPGISIGLAWTPVGGEIMFIEATLTAGMGRFALTGQIGDVMRESAQAAMTYIHTIADKLGIPEEMFFRRDIHIHVPAGAIPKDGPSAGIAIATAIASLLTGHSVKDFLAMSGEITLKGNVLPVGGVKEKVLAAARANIRAIILAERNRIEVEQLPAEVQKKMQIIYVSQVEEVLQIALNAKPHSKASPLRKPKPYEMLAPQTQPTNPADQRRVDPKLKPNSKPQSPAKPTRKAPPKTTPNKRKEPPVPKAPRKDPPAPKPARKDPPVSKIVSKSKVAQKLKSPAAVKRVTTTRPVRKRGKN